MREAMKNKKDLTRSFNRNKIKIFFSIQGKKNKKKLEATREMVDIRNL